MSEATNSPGQVIIMRGLPGSGKKTFVKSFFPSAKVISSESFFSGDFDKTKLQEVYKANFEVFKKLVDEKCPLIVVNNINIKHFHYYHYIDWAQSFGYKVGVIIIPHNDVSDRELSQRSNVPQHIISRMRREFEWPI